MSSESSLWKSLSKIMKHYWIARRLECSYPSGVPDVYYRLPHHGRWYPGWIELKYLPKYPKNRTLKIRIDHFTKEQKLWIRQELRTGGVSLLLLKIERTVFLLDEKTALNIENFCYNQLMELSLLPTMRLYAENIYDALAKHHLKREKK